MISCKMDLDGFTVVKKGGRRKTFKRTTVLASKEDQQDELDLDKETLKVAQAVEELRKTKLFDHVSVHLSKLVGSCEELWCFGLGHIGGCVSARFQLALLLLIREFLHIPEERVFVSDPIFFCGEVELLRKLKLEVISENLECKLKCQVPSLIFLPHCPKQLTNNLLYANWSPQGLAKLSLISNSFSSTVERGVKSDLERNAQLLCSLAEAEMVEEVKMSNSFRFEDVFNDMALHQFSRMDGAKEGFWDVKPPDYSEDAEFIRSSCAR